MAQRALPLAHCPSSPARHQPTHPPNRTNHPSARARAQCRQSSAADVYSFGLLVYECVTTTAPFKGLLPAQILFSKTSNADWKHLVWPGWVPARVQELAMRCADQNPGNRYTAAQAREELVLLTQLHSGPSSSGLPQPPPPPAVAVV